MTLRGLSHPLHAIYYTVYWLDIITDQVHITGINPPARSGWIRKRIIAELEVGSTGDSTQLRPSEGSSIG